MCWKLFIILVEKEMQNTNKKFQYCLLSAIRIGISFSLKYWNAYDIHIVKEEQTKTKLSVSSLLFTIFFGKNNILQYLFACYNSLQQWL